MNYRTLACAALGAASPALATQSINVDIGSTAFGFGVPSSAFGAASGSQGTWNGIDADAMVNGSPVFNSGPLLDTAGSMTAVSIEFDSMGLGFGAAEFDEPSTQGDDQALLDVVFCVNGLHTMTVSGLQPGAYEVYVYAMAPDDPLEFTTVAVQGSPDPLATVGGDFALGYQRNVTHSLHNVTVAASGDIVISIDFTGFFDSVAGIQIFDGVTGSLGIGTPYCMAAQNSTGAVGAADSVGQHSGQRQRCDLDGHAPTAERLWLLPREHGASLHHESRW